MMLLCPFAAAYDKSYQAPAQQHYGTEYPYRQPADGKNQRQGKSGP